MTFSKQAPFIKGFVVLVLSAVVAMVGLPLGGHLSNVTPDAVKAVFDSKAAVLMVAWGLIHTRFPALAKLPNDLHGWLTTLAYIVGSFAVPDAHAGVLTPVAHYLAPALVVFRGALTSALTSLLYDKLVKSHLDVLIPKA